MDTYIYGAVAYAILVLQRNVSNPTYQGSDGTKSHFSLHPTSCLCIVPSRVTLAEGLQPCQSTYSLTPSGRLFSPNRAKDNINYTGHWIH